MVSLELNAALERLAQVTTNRSYSPASPLQALVRLRQIRKRVRSFFLQSRSRYPELEN